MFVCKAPTIIPDLPQGGGATGILFWGISPGRLALAATRWDNLGVLPPRATLAKLSPSNASQDVEISPTLLDSHNVQEFGNGHVARSSLE